MLDEKARRIRRHAQYSIFPTAASGLGARAAFGPYRNCELFAIGNVYKLRRMEPQHVPSAAAALPELRVSSTTTSAEAAAAMRVFADFNGCMVGAVRFSGRTPWERHPGDEMLYVVDGAVDVIVLFDDGAQHTTLTAGSVFIVPSGRWHRQEPRPLVSLMFVTPAEGTDASWSDDPRSDERQPPAQPPANDVRTA